MRTWRSIATSLALPLSVGLIAQDTLSLDAAIRMALANEHGIRIARNEAAIADAQATAGNAGLLPRVEASGRGTYSDQFSRLDFAEPLPDVERDGVVNTALSGQLGLSYTLFNGLGTFAAHDRAQLQARVADLRARAQVEATLMQVVALYYQLAALDQDVAITERLLGISVERFRRQEGRAALGGTGRLELLNAQVDLQADSSAWIMALQRRERTLRDLNVLLGRSPAASAVPSRQVTYANGLSEELLVEEALRGNAQLQAAMAQVRAAEADERVAKAMRWPRLDLSAAYGVSDQRNEVGIVLGTYTRGLNGGLTLSVPLFDGGRVGTQVEAARLRAESAALAEQQARLQVERDVRNGFTTWRSQREVLRIQQEAMRAAELNFERTRELYQSGLLTALQFRQAQLDLANAQRQAVVAGFDAKVAELQLLRASGGLLTGLGIRDLR
ncbi:MAG: TolC family protein [Flavobacteriales bacterium]|nr:MAG: TolC family protein [Flavobacteriales bacterium]